jgi:AraC-like DNA-binding protein
MLLFIQPIPELIRYITKIWLVENDYGLPANNIVAPNARPKIIIPYLNAITTKSALNTRTCAEGGIYFIGVRDVPVELSTPRARTGSIGFEFTTESAYKFFRGPMSDLANDLFSFEDCFGNEGANLQKEVHDLEDPYGKIRRVQEFLLRKLRSQQRANNIVDYSIKLISQSHGLMGIRELEGKTGYTKRYLDLLFKDYVGIAPKTLSTILRFQHFYKVVGIQKKSIYDLYYDESHFIKEFKRYTGYSPRQFSRIENDFGRNF